MSTTITDMHNVEAISQIGGSPFGAIANVCIITGNTLDSPWASLPRIKEATPSQTIEEATLTDEGGNVFTVAGGTDESTWEITFVQQDKATKTLHETFKDVRVSLAKEEYRYPVNGKYQIRIAPYAKIVPTYEGSTGGETTYTWKCEPLPSAMVINIASISAAAGCYHSFTCTSLTLPANTKMYLYEE